MTGHLSFVKGNSVGDCRATGFAAVDLLAGRTRRRQVRPRGGLGHTRFVVRMDAGLAAILGGLRATGCRQAIREEWDRATQPATPRGELDFAFWAARR